MNDKELKPCPFCGGEAQIFYEKANAAGTKFSYWVECTKTDAELRELGVCDIAPYTRKFGTKERAIEAWNRRATMNNEFKVDDVSEQSFRSGYTQGKSEDSIW